MVSKLVQVLIGFTPKVLRFPIQSQWYLVILSHMYQFVSVSQCNLTLFHVWHIYVYNVVILQHVSMCRIAHSAGLVRAFELISDGE